MSSRAAVGLGTFRVVSREKSEMTAGKFFELPKDGTITLRYEDEDEVSVCVGNGDVEAEIARVSVVEGPLQLEMLGKRYAPSTRTRPLSRMPGALSRATEMAERIAQLGNDDRRMLRALAKLEREGALGIEDDENEPPPAIERLRWLGFVDFFREGHHWRARLNDYGRWAIGDPELRARGIPMMGVRTSGDLLEAASQAFRAPWQDDEKKK